ncbi:MFS transporter [Novosphingobium mangrovi (ex Hu et al. 2023)]|uniref:MFS transporter n=1 Tax=Novosphingobium mangrovi (ex Hu et al. 2023) TaxID=2930094 RepID=A0ABT0AF70_9SPHN|nr:MFS transporter [Novosphingobium mangrovi (ex Hu et al. 2023)]MCJ1961836.1 MFS transporter [Novosphingobium mangrovi (ex Hu et al. 2023)]
MASEFKKGWKVVFAALLATACGASPIPFNVLPLVMGPIHDEFGWDYTQISAATLMWGVLGAMLAPVYGGFCDRFGVRRVGILSMLAFILVFASFYFVPDWLPGWYMWWAALGLVAIGSTPVTWSRAVAMWFDRHRGLALGIMLLGTSATAMFVPHFVNFAINLGGWRAAFPAATVFALFLAMPFILAWFREPRPEERPATLEQAADGDVVGLSLRQAMHGRQFWILLVSTLLISFSYGGAHIHMAQMVELHGFTAGDAATVMSCVALGILIGRLGIGYLFDRFWAPGVAFPAMLLPAIACYLLMGTSTSFPLILFGGFLIGVAAGTETDIVAFMTARYFGLRHYGRIYGFLYAPFGIGSAISPMLYGYVRDTTGSYDLMLTVAVVLFAIGGAALLALGRYPGREQLSRRDV